MGKAAPSPGALYLVATPIGNLEDITLRALRILGEVDCIAAEDTRRTRKLLSHYGIHTRLVSYHEHNEERRAAELLEDLLAGRSIAVVSDAGMPGISDPGLKIVEKAHGAGIPVHSIPGPCAVVAALCVSGLSATRFSFLGFPPRRQAARKAFFEEVVNDPGTLVFYESPRRLQPTLKDLLAVLGDREAVICRELTKQHEEIMRGRLSEVLEECLKRDLRGEVCILVAGYAPSLSLSCPDSKALLEKCKEIQRKGRLGVKEAVKEAAKVCGVSRRRLYQLVLAHREEGGRVEDRDEDE